MDLLGGFSGSDLGGGHSSLPLLDADGVSELLLAHAPSAADEAGGEPAVSSARPAATECSQSSGERERRH
jgi:hypothetical protein